MARKQKNTYPNSLRLSDVFSYDLNTGVITWKICSSPQARVSVGDVAGTIDVYGYRVIAFNKKRYKAHRLAWFLHHHSWPEQDIDHINQNKDDNRLVNLRLATPLQNRCNQGKRKHNTSGFKNVYRNKYASENAKKWCARLQYQGVRIYLGYFDTPEEAHAAYCAAAIKYHGEFANLGMTQ